MIAIIAAVLWVLLVGWSIIWNLMEALTIATLFRQRVWGCGALPVPLLLPSPSMMNRSDRSPLPEKKCPICGDDMVAHEGGAGRPYWRCARTRYSCCRGVFIDISTD